MESSTTKELLMSSFMAKQSVSTPVKGSSACSVVSTPDRSYSLPHTRIHTRAGSLSDGLSPQKYETLCEFFNALVSSVRLLRLKRLTPTLTTLTQSIESLTDGRFTMSHLAQLKHVMPEVIVVKKIRIVDEESACMKEELVVSLETDKHSKENGSVYCELKRVFQTRIIEFSTTHPEYQGEDMPKAELPEPFYKPKQEPEPESQSSMSQTHLLQPTTLTSPSFKRRFSSKALSEPVSEQIIVKPLRETKTPIKTATLTPEKYTSTPAKFASTPALNMDKRSIMTDDDDDDATHLPSKSTNRRVLNFDDENDERNHKDLREVLPENLFHSKEQRTLQELDPAEVQARKREQLMAGVAKLLDMTQLLFQSIRRSVMTKEQLIHSIIAGNLDIVDKLEVQEQLKLLQEVAPEFISEKSCLSGDTLLCLNKYACAESVRAKIFSGQLIAHAFVILPWHDLA